MKDTNGYSLQYYVVCVIDVLGQQSRLAQWRELPLNGLLDAKLISALKNTLGIVLGFKDIFERYFKEVSQCTMPDRIAALSEEQQALYKRYRDCTLKTQQFSDTFVFYAPLQNVFGDLSVIQVHEILGACSMAMLISLAARIPVRGGMSIGVGTEIEDHGFYGPALAEAHYLESKKAKYPRIVLSSRVPQLLRTIEANAAKGVIERMMSGMAKECLNMIAMDSDGVWIVDYMGTGMKKYLPLIQELNRAVFCAHAFVCSEADRFRAEENDLLATCYERLRSYIESRLELWKVDQDVSSEGPG
jgi:hypothetical protein